MFKRIMFRFFVIVTAAFGSMAYAQDSNGPSPLSALDTTNQPYSILVDGSLPQDNPAPRPAEPLFGAKSGAIRELRVVGRR